MLLYVSFQGDGQIQFGSVTLCGNEEAVFPLNAFVWPLQVRVGDHSVLLATAESQTVAFGNCFLTITVNNFVTVPHTEFVLSAASALALVSATPLASLDAVAQTLAVHLPADKASWLLAKLAGSSASPHTPLAAFLRGMCRSYFNAELGSAFGPILQEIGAVNLTTKSLADQTTFASLAVRVLTAAVDIVNNKMPHIFVSSLAEPMRIQIHGARIPSFDYDSGRMSSFAGATLCISLVTCAFCFSIHDQVDSEGHQLLLRVYRVVVKAIENSICESPDLLTDDSTDGALIRGLAADLRSKAPFATLLNNRHTVNLIDPVDFPEASAVLRALMPYQQPVQKSLFALIESFQKVAFARESTPQHQLHYFHQYHLHEQSRLNVHHNTQ